MKHSIKWSSKHLQENFITNNTAKISGVTLNPILFILSLKLVSYRNSLFVCLGGDRPRAEQVGPGGDGAAHVAATHPRGHDKTLAGRGHSRREAGDYTEEGARSTYAVSEGWKPKVILFVLNTSIRLRLPCVVPTRIKSSLIIVHELKVLTYPNTHPNVFTP